MSKQHRLLTGKLTRHTRRREAGLEVGDRQAFRPSPDSPGFVTETESRREKCVYGGKHFNTFVSFY